MTIVGRDTEGVTRPVISVVMPARNAARTVGSAVRSTLSALPTNSELLVHDDASEDDTHSVLTSISDTRISVSRSKEPLGVAGALNALIARSRSPIIARMDADDLTLPGRFARQRQVLSEADVVFTTRINFGSTPRAYRPSSLTSIEPATMRLLMVFENPVAHSSMLGQRQALAVGPPYLPGAAEDYQLWLRLMTNGARLARTAVPGIAYRLHPQQVTRSNGWLKRFAEDENLATAHDGFLRSLGWAEEGVWSMLRGETPLSTSRRGDLGRLIRFVDEKARSLTRLGRAQVRWATRRWR